MIDYTYQPVCLVDEGDDVPECINVYLIMGALQCLLSGKLLHC